MSVELAATIYLRVPFDSLYVCVHSDPMPGLAASAAFASPFPFFSSLSQQIRSHRYTPYLRHHTNTLKNMHTRSGPQHQRQPILHLHRRNAVAQRQARCLWQGRVGHGGGAKNERLGARNGQAARRSRHYRQRRGLKYKRSFYVINYLCVHTTR